MKIISYIPIALFVLSNTVYDFYHTPKSTAWSIFYFSSMYLSLLTWSVNEAYKGNIYERLYFGAMSSGLFLRIAIEISKKGMDYDDYMNSINNSEKSLLFAAWLIAALLPVVHKLWKKQT